MSAMNPLQACKQVAAKLSDDELLELNTHVVQVLRRRQAEKQQQAASKFRLGDLVQFIHTKTGENIQIRVTQFNLKTLSGEEHTPRKGRKWRVAPSMCRLVGGGL